MKGLLRRCAAAMIAAMTAAMVLPAAPAYAAGWVKQGSGYYYVQDDGAALYNTMTPDGYYVDGNGLWFQEDLLILRQRVTSPQRFVPMNSQYFGNYLATVNSMSTLIQDAAPGRRRIHLYRDGMSICAIENQKETVLIRLSEDTATGGYLLRLSTNLGSGSFVETDLRTYDNEVFRYMCAIISNRPTILADAIYQSWQGSNGYGINMTGWTPVGDTRVMVQVENGAGIYRIAPR